MTVALRTPFAGHWTATNLRALPCFVLLVAAAAFCLPAPAAALTAQAVVDRNEISSEDSIVLTVVLTNGNGEVDTSAISDFSVSSRGTSTSMQILNTQVTREIRHQYLLTPLRTGSLTIPPLAVRDGRTVVHTDSIAIRVHERTAQPAARRDVEVEATVSERAPFVGQELVYTFKLHTAVQLVRAGFEEPSFDGFAVTKLEDQRSYSTVRNGREYRVTEVSFLLVPQHSGTLTIGPATVTCEVPTQRRRRSRSLFDDPFFGRVDTVRKTVRTPPVPVTVSPLPDYPGDGVFSGLVGSFSLSATLEPRTVPAGESSTLTVTLQGAGNVQEAPPPEWALPSSTKVYPDEPEADIARDFEGTRGTKRFRYAVVPTTAGPLRLGPLELVVFDPARKEYVKLRAGPLELAVEPAAEPEATAAVTSPVGLDEGGSVFRRKEKVEKTGHDILSVRRELDVLNTREDMGPLAFSLWLLTPALACGVVGLAATRLRRTPSAPEQMARRAEDLLAEAGDAGERAERLGLLHRALASAVFARAGRAGESLTYQEAGELLRASGTEDDNATRVVSLLDRIDSARYGGADDGDTGLKTLEAETAAAIRELLKGRKT